jgi:hypothetical protein
MADAGDATTVEKMSEQAHTSENATEETRVSQQGEEAIEQGSPSDATTPAALPGLTLPDKVKEAIERRNSRAYSLSAGRPSQTSMNAASDDAVIIGIAVVDFNHLLGPTIEYAHPQEVANDEELKAKLPFLALPDGSHLSDEDFCYFHVHSSHLHSGTIFGISCNRQIASDKLIVRGKDVTRSTVQKAVVVLARDPVFGPIREKLGIVTRAFFAQGDFGDVDILVEFHATLEAGLISAQAAISIEVRKEDEGDATIQAMKAKHEEEQRERDAVMYMGTSLRELVYKWRFKTLMLLKLLLLQRKMMFFGYPVERLCTYQYSLISLVPDLLFNLQDAVLPSLDSQTSKRKRAESLKTSDRKSLMRFMGFPLHLFGEGAFFQPYLPLQQLDVATNSSSFLVGTTNTIFRMQKECTIDVIVDLEQSSIEFLDTTLQSLVNLTPADRKWMDEIVHVVLDTWNADDPSRPRTMEYVGSDDYLRAKFEEYLCSLLSSIKYADYVSTQEAGCESIIAPDTGSTSDAFGAEFVHAFKTTKCFALWDRTTDAMVFDLFEHKHPCDGKTSTLEDVSLRLTSGIYDLHLDEKVAPTREMVTNALNEGGKTAWKFANKWGQDIARFRREQMAQLVAARQQQQQQDAQISKGSEVRDENSVDTTLHAPEKGIHHVSSSAAVDATVPTSAGFLTPAQQQAAQDLQRQAQQAAMQAGTQVRAALTGFGSFLSAKQKAWSTPTSTSTQTPSASPSQDGGKEAAP